MWLVLITFVCVQLASSGTVQGEVALCEYATQNQVHQVCHLFCNELQQIEEGMEKRRPLPLKRRPLPLKRAEYYVEADDLPLKRGAPAKLPLKRAAGRKLPLKRAPLPLKRARIMGLIPLKRDVSVVDEDRSLAALPLKRGGGRAFGYYSPRFSRSRVGIWPWMYDVVQRGSKTYHKRSVDEEYNDIDDSTGLLPLKRAPLPLKRAPLPLKRAPLPLKRAEGNILQWERSLESDMCLCYGMCRQRQLQAICQCQ